MLQFMIRRDGTGTMKCPFCEAEMEFQKFKPQFENKQIFIDVPSSLLTKTTLIVRDLLCKTCHTTIDCLEFTNQEYQVKGE